LRGEAAAVEREGEAVAGEGRDDGGLVADGPEIFGDGVATEEAVGDGADGERSREERLGAGETRAEVRGLGEKRGECVPAAAGVAEEVALDDEAEVGGGGLDVWGVRNAGLSTALRFGRDDSFLGGAVRRLFYEGEAAVAAGDEEELDGVAELGELGGSEAEVHLEADEVGVRAEQRAREAAEVVLAGGEEDVRGGESVGVTGAGDGDAPEVAVAVEGFGGVAAKDESMCGGGALEEGFIERAAGEGLRGEGEGCGGDAEGAGEADVVNGDGAECGEIEAEAVEAGESFGGEKVAADLVVGLDGTLEEGDAATGEGELDGCGGAGGAAAENDCVEVAGGAANPRLRSETWGTRFVVICSKCRGLSTTRPLAQTLRSR
jgi:hypothetical protein